jgi:hypothetical protein
MLSNDRTLILGPGIDTKALREDPAYHIGAIDETATSFAGGWLTGWALEKATSRPAVGLIVMSSEGAIVLTPNLKRNDLLAGFGPDAISCGYRADIPLHVIRPLFAPDMKYYAFNGDSIITPLPVTKTNDKLSQLQIATEADFYRLVQTPSTRISDTTTIMHLAFHALARSTDNYVLGAAAGCVLGYRLLEGEASAQQRREVIMAAIHRLLDENTETIPRGLFLRWHTSLRLVAGYLAYQASDDTEALAHFGDIVNYFLDLKKWPQALTNILIGIAITGYLLYEQGAVAKAIDIWSRAEDVLRYGASVAEFQNFYAYGELGNAVQVAQFSHTAALCARHGGVLNNPAVAPLNTSIDIRKIVGPISSLTAERRRLAFERA